MNLIAAAHHAMIAGGAIFIGLGTNSWMVGFGVWLCFVALYKPDHEK
jgi:hypothetical protein